VRLSSLCEQTGAMDYLEYFLTGPDNLKKIPYLVLVGKRLNLDVAELRARYQFDSLQAFLDLHYVNLRVLQREEDFYDLARAYLTRAAVAGVRCNVGSSASWPQIRMFAGFLSRCFVCCAQVPGKMATAAFMRRAHALGLDVHVWTINDRAQMIRYLDLGADGIMTDDVETLRDVLIERGQWHPRVGSATA